MQGGVSELIQPQDVLNAANENWEEFKKQAQKDPLYYNGPGDLLDTAEGRAKFCRLNETGVLSFPVTKYGFSIFRAKE